MDYIPPVGGRFLPEDQELVGYFLLKKLNGVLSQEEAHWVPDCDLYGKEEPWVMFQRLKTGLSGGDVFVFTELKSKDNGKRNIDRRIGGGCWHGEDSGKDIAVDAQIKGKKKRFSYKNKDSDHHGGWILHEYSLPNFPIVLCRLRNKSSDQNPESEATDGPVLDFDFFDVNVEGSHKRRRPEFENPAAMDGENATATAQPDLANNSDSPTEERSHGAELESNNTTATAQLNLASKADSPTEERTNLEPEFNNGSVKRRRLEFNSSADNCNAANIELNNLAQRLELALEQDRYDLEALIGGSSSFDNDFDSLFKGVPAV